MQSGERIRHFRKKRGITQKNFAENLGYSQNFLSAIELGKVEPSREFLKRLNEVLGISSDYILYGSPPGQGEESLIGHPGEYLESRKEVIVVREPKSKYQVLPTATKKFLNGVVEILESGNEVMIDALRANIKAFLEAVRVSKKHDEDKGGKI